MRLGVGGEGKEKKNIGLKVQVDMTFNKKGGTAHIFPIKGVIDILDELGEGGWGLDEVSGPFSSF